jgi:hypothetical protein
MKRTKKLTIEEPKQNMKPFDEIEIYTEERTAKRQTLFILACIIFMTGCLVFIRFI